MQNNSHLLVILLLNIHIVEYVNISRLTENDIGHI